VDVSGSEVVSAIRTLELALFEFAAAFLNGMRIIYGQLFVLAATFALGTYWPNETWARGLVIVNCCAVALGAWALGSVVTRAAKRLQCSLAKLRKAAK
jgi:hypothetical protein